jgi:uncharacterized membrane protein YeaQ/YmgE (transglycosylase-associated protein family)
MAFVWMFLVGAMVGVLAWLPPGSPRGAWPMYLTLGVAGSVVAGFMGRGMGFYDRPGVGVAIVASLVGATLIVLVYRAARKPGPG